MDTSVSANNFEIDTYRRALRGQASGTTRWRLYALGVTGAFCILEVFIMTHLAQTATSGETERGLFLIVRGAFLTTFAICGLEFVLLLRRQSSKQR
jgi:bacteriorhodopsin